MLDINKPYLHLLYHFNRKSLYLRLQLNTSSPSPSLQPPAIPLYSFCQILNLNYKTKHRICTSLPFCYCMVPFLWSRSLKAKFWGDSFPHAGVWELLSSWNYTNNLYYRKDNILWKKWVCKNKERLCLKCWKIIFVAQQEATKDNIRSGNECFVVEGELWRSKSLGKQCRAYMKFFLKKRSDYQNFKTWNRKQLYMQRVISFRHLILLVFIKFSVTSS